MSIGEPSQIENQIVCGKLGLNFDCSDILLQTMHIFMLHVNGIAMLHTICQW